MDQFQCDSQVLAPEGCLQYFTGIAGNVSSFNWKTEANSADGTTSATWPNQISSLKYINLSQLILLSLSFIA